MEKGIVIKPLAALKALPETNSETVDEALYGTVLNILEIGDWLKVETLYGYKGYISKLDVQMDGQMAEEWGKPCPYVIAAPLADVLAEPKYASMVLLTLPLASQVQKTDIIEDKWEKVLLADGTKGWIRKGFATEIEALSPKKDEELLRHRLVMAAMSYMGTQYRWGGKSPLGIDCSGLAFMAFYLNGQLIPRDSGDQKKYLRPIERNQAKPGDLYFFPGHVAICIGEDRYIHATGREGFVLVNSFNPNHHEYRKDLDESCTGVGTLF